MGAVSLKLPEDLCGCKAQPGSQGLSASPAPELIEMPWELSSPLELRAPGSGHGGRARVLGSDPAPAPSPPPPQPLPAGRTTPGAGGDRSRKCDAIHRTISGGDRFAARRDLGGRASTRIRGAEVGKVRPVVVSRPIRFGGGLATV